MCGIWLYMRKSDHQLQVSSGFEHFMKLKPRGPDNSIFKISDDFIIGFHRLAIMGSIEDGSDQPFVINCRETKDTIICLCNGEIYNFIELNDKYRLGVTDNADCSVIPLLYKKCGFSVSKFTALFTQIVKGEFAFILVHLTCDKKVKRIITGRDAIGVRPLYICNTNQYLVLSSEIKGIQFQDEFISESPPGKVSVYKQYDTKVQTIEFSTIYKTKPELPLLDNESAITSNLRHSLINSVSRRLIANRPISFLLSGGLDSSIVCAIATKLLGLENISTFCCGLGGGGTDMKYANIMAEYLNSSHTNVMFTEQEALETVPKVIECVETWDTTTIRASVGQYLVSQYISQNTDCKVVMVGETSDELLSGYVTNYYCKDPELLHETAMKYVKEVHIFDCRRVDRCVSHFGLEARVPYADPEFALAAWTVPSEWRLPSYKGIEKYYLRKAFSDILPHEILWRKKEAMSDGISSRDRSWFTILQEHISKTHHMDERDYYKKHFIEIYGNKFADVIPHYWQPAFTNDNTQNTEYVDPSARVLDVY